MGPKDLPLIAVVRGSENGKVADSRLILEKLADNFRNLFSIGILTYSNLTHENSGSKGLFLVKLGFAMFLSS